MISSFLRSTIFRKPSSSNSPMSPVCSQPSASIASAVFSGCVAVAEHHELAADEHLAVVAERHLDAGRRRADGADPDLAGPVAGSESAGLGHPPQLGELDPERVEELEHLDRGRRGADVDRDQPGRARASRAASRTSARRRARPAASSSGGTGSPRWRSRTRSIAGCSASSTGLRCSAGCAALHRVEAGLQLLPDPRDREEPVRPDLRQVGHDIARVRAGRDRARVDDRDVVVGHPLGDVGRRQPRDQPRSGASGISSSIACAENMIA